MITELTAEQEALIPVYREKWRAIALSTERIDRQKAAEAVKAAYAVNRLKEPEIIMCDSPYAGLLELTKLQKSLRRLGRGLNQEVQHHNKWFFAELTSNSGSQVRDQLEKSLNYLGYLFQPLTQQLEAQLFRSHVEPAVFYNRISVDALAASYSYWDFCFSVLNKEHNALEWETSEALLQTCGWIFPFAKVCIVCDRPTKILFDETNLLHALGESAIQFADGFSVYAYHGALMPEKYSSVAPSQWQPQWYQEESESRLRQALIEVLPSEQLQVQWLVEESNVNLRQLLIQKLEHHRILHELKIENDLELLSQSLQDSLGSSFWIAYTLLQNLEEPSIQRAIETRKDSKDRFTEFRKAILISSLERILYWLQQNVPSHAEEFLPGLTCEAIAEKTENLPFKLPKEVYDLYQWRNGTDSEAMLFIYHYFWHLDMALETSEYINEPWWLEMRIWGNEPIYLFPIFEFEGEYFAVQGNTVEVETAPVFHVGSDGGDMNLAFNSLTTMMLAIAESYETGVYQVNSEYSGSVEWADMEKSRLIRLKYNPGTVERLYGDGG